VVGEKRAVVVTRRGGGCKKMVFLPGTLYDAWGARITFGQCIIFVACGLVGREMSPFEVVLLLNALIRFVSYCCRWVWVRVVVYILLEGKGWKGGTVYFLQGVGYCDDK
jgi:hypothetical protein